MKRKLAEVLGYLKRITLPQAIALAAGVACLYLLHDRVGFPTTIDGWKQVVDLAIYALGATATAGAIAHGSAAPAPRAARSRETEPPEGGP